MAIDKALYQAPEGIDALAENEEPLEIEILDPEMEEEVVLDARRIVVNINQTSLGAVRRRVNDVIHRKTCHLCP